MAKKIFIIGIGRSGTTAIYSILQRIIRIQLQKGVEFVYEPFLWDRSVFNKMYTDINDEFDNVSSLSVDAIYNHKKLPLFIDEEHVHKYLNNGFVQSLTEPEVPNNILLAKYIRANGRILLLKQLAPDAKFIFLLRNPLDVINSSINMFSFYGGELFSSDYSRFRRQVKEIWGENAASHKLRDVSECDYWFYMNRFVVDRYDDNDSNILPVFYENYIQNRGAELLRICEFMNVKFDQSYVAESERKIGPSNSFSNLTKRGYQSLLPYLERYQEFANILGQNIDLDKINNKYQSRKFSESYLTRYDGKTVFYIKRALVKRESSKIDRIRNKVGSLFKVN